MVGVMIAAAPGKVNITTSAMFRLLWKIMLHSSPAMIWLGLKGALDDESHRPKRPNYYLETIAVAPKYQGKGIGSIMLSYLTGLADRDGVVTYLSTTDPRTLPLYKRHGFRIISETDQSGAPNLHMEREPNVHG